MAHWSDGPFIWWPIGPMAHWSGSPFARWSIGPMAHWSDGPFIWWPIGPMTHWSGDPLVLKALVLRPIGPKTHRRWSENPLIDIGLKKCHFDIVTASLSFDIGPKTHWSEVKVGFDNRWHMNRKQISKKNNIKAYIVFTYTSYTYTYTYMYIILYKYYQL